MGNGKDDKLDVIAGRDPFLAEMSEVVPIDRRDAPLPRQREISAMSAAKDDDLEVDELQALVTGQGAFDLRSTDEHFEGLPKGVDRKLLRKLRKGAYAYRRHLDLHGLTRTEAKAAVASFIGQSREEGERCVLIVHGRGHHSKDNVPVLKEALAGWLSGRNLGRVVLAFCSARPSDGGVGAAYVLLRK